MPAEKPKEDLELPFYRARRTLRHLWHIYRKDKSFNPNGCDGCREIHSFLTDPNFRGDEHYPIGVTIDRDVTLGPDDMEVAHTEPRTN